MITDQVLFFFAAKPTSLRVRWNRCRLNGLTSGDYTVHCCTKLVHKHSVRSRWSQDVYTNTQASRVKIEPYGKWSPLIGIIISSQILLDERGSVPSVSSWGVVNRVSIILAGRTLSCFWQNVRDRGVMREAIAWAIYMFYLKTTL
jgi:hypothetical protein